MKDDLDYRVTEPTTISMPIYGLWIPDGGADRKGCWMVDCTTEDNEHPAVFYSLAQAEAAHKHETEQCGVTCEVVALYAGTMPDPLARPEADPLVIAHRTEALRALKYTLGELRTSLAGRGQAANVIKRAVMVWMLEHPMGTEGRLGKPSYYAVAKALGVHHTTVLYHRNLATAEAAARKEKP